MSNKILIINGFESQGGAESVYQQSIQALSSNNTVFTASSEEVEDRNHLLLKDTLSNGIFSIFSFLFSFANLFRLIKFCKDNDINTIIVHNFMANLSPSILYGMRLLKRQRNVKLIQYLHDYHVICPNSSLYSYGNNRICNACVGNKKYHILYKNCDRRGWLFSWLKYLRFMFYSLCSPKNIFDIFISPSDFLANKLINDGVKPDKIHVIRNSFEPPIKASISHNTLDFTNEFSQAIKVCYFGRLSDEKDIETLIRAVKETYNIGLNIKLDIIGSGPKEKDLISLVNQLFLNHIVNFKPFMDKNDLLSYITNFDLFVLPSKCYENMPVSLIEAACAGLYPIACNHGGMSEVIRLLGFGSTFECGNVKQLSSLLVKHESDSSKGKVKVDESVISMLSYNVYKKMLNDLLR